MDNGRRQRAELTRIQTGVRVNKSIKAEENRLRQRKIQKQAEADARRSNLPSLDRQPSLGNSALASPEMLVKNYDSVR